MLKKLTHFDDDEATFQLQQDPCHQDQEQKLSKRTLHSECQHFDCQMHSSLKSFPNYLPFICFSNQVDLIVDFLKQRMYYHLVSPIPEYSPEHISPCL